MTNSSLSYLTNVTAGSFLPMGNTTFSVNYNCACGQPATRAFYNPKGISNPVNETVYSLLLCSGCDFRFTVMRTAGRSEEFIADYEEKRKVREVEEAERNQEAQHAWDQQAQSQMKQQAQNVYGQGTGHSNLARSVKPASCTGYVQSPEEPKNPWWKVW